MKTFLILLMTTLVYSFSWTANAEENLPWLDASQKNKVEIKKNKKEDVFTIRFRKDETGVPLRAGDDLDKIILGLKKDKNRRLSVKSYASGNSSDTKSKSASLI